MLEMLSPGLLSLIEDAGRPGYRQYGVPESGAMDFWSLRLANRLVGNAPSDAAIECLLLPPKVRFHSLRVAAVTGGACRVTVENENGARELPTHMAFLVRAGETVSMTPLTAGCRVYLAVSGGFALSPVMGSVSASPAARVGGLGNGQKLAAGDAIPLRRNPAALPPTGAAIPEARRVPLATGGETPLRVIWGPQDGLFSDAGRATFLSAPYTVAQESDRMGVRLSGEPIAHREGCDGNILSDAIAFGAIQVPKNGQPILMMAERQTTGGYAKIANVITADLPRAAQLRPGDRVRFIACTQEEAVAALREIRSFLSL